MAEGLPPTMLSLQENNSNLRLKPEEFLRMQGSM